MEIKWDLLKTALGFTLVRPVKIGLIIPLVLVSLEYLMNLAHPPRSLLRFLPLILGVVIYVWCAVDFLRGGGTPYPKQPPKKLVVKGLYRLTRNPMYIGVLLMIVGVGVAFRSVAVLYYAIVRLQVFHNAVTNREEHGLRKRHGDAYVEYCERVPRWIPLPFFPPLAEGSRGYYGAGLPKPGREPSSSES